MRLTDNEKKKKHPMYVGCFFAMQIFLQNTDSLHGAAGFAALVGDVGFDERMCFAVSHDREEKHLIGVVKAKAIIGHGIASIGGFHLIAAEFLTV